jgi:hypothetical protein
MQGGEQERIDVYGFWPALCGLGLAAGIFFVMFALATGFS